MKYINLIESNKLPQDIIYSVYDNQTKKLLEIKHFGVNNYQDLHNQIYSFYPLASSMIRWYDKNVTIVSTSKKEDDVLDYDAPFYMDVSMNNPVVFTQEKNKRKMVLESFQEFAPSIYRSSFQAKKTYIIKISKEKISKTLHGSVI